MGDRRIHHKPPKRRRWTWTTALACALAIVLPGAARAEQSPAELLADLEAEGFENLSVEEISDGQGVVITFENRRYRWEVVGLGVALGLATAHQEGRVILVPMHTGLPMGRIEVDAPDYRAFLRGELSEEEIFSRMVISSEAGPYEPGPHNSSFGKVDLTFAPGVRINLVTPAPPGVFRGGEVRLSPGVYSNLWRGLSFDATYVYPLSSSKPVVGRATGSVNARVGTEGFFQAQAGRLSEGLDGFAAGLVYPSKDGRHLLGASIAQAAYPGWDRSGSYQAFWTWRPTRYDATATLAWGKFLAGDTGYSLTLISGFRESNIEFSYTKTSLSEVLAAGFTVPLGWERQARPAPVRLRFRNAFRFMYYDENPRPLDGGLYVPFMDGYQTAIRRWNRAYLRTYAHELREAARKWVPAEVTESRE